MEKYKAKRADLLTPEGFNKAFEKSLKAHQNKKYKDAYEAVENIYEMCFGIRKYSSYESFRQIRIRIIKKNKKRNNVTPLKNG